MCAVKVDGLEKRVDSYVFDPNYIQVDWAENGRFTRPSPESLRSLAKSIAAQGQEQPVGIRFIKREDGAKVPKLVAGYRRTESIRQWNEEHPDQKLSVWCVDLGKGNAEDDLHKNIAENRERKNNSPADEAYQVKKLSQVFHKTDQEIAELYGVEVSWVKDRQALLELSTAQLLDLHEERATLEYSLTLARMPEGQRKKVEERIAKEREQEAQQEEKERLASKAAESPAPNDLEPSRQSKATPGQGHKGKKEKKAKPAKKKTAADLKKAQRAEGIKTPRKWPELKEVLEAHQAKNHRARVLLAFMKDEATEIELMEALR
jgi:hypothetical protein